MYLLGVIRAAPRIHLPRLDPESISTVFNVAFNTCYTLLHLPKSFLTPINKTISGIAPFLIAACVNDVCLQGTRELVMAIYDKTKAQQKKKKEEEKATGTSREGGAEGETGIMIMLRRQLFSCGEQLYPLKGMKAEPAQEPLSMRHDSKGSPDGKKSCMQMCVECKQVAIRYMQLGRILIESRKFLRSACRSSREISCLMSSGASSCLRPDDVVVMSSGLRWETAAFLQTSSIHDADVGL